MLKFLLPAAVVTAASLSALTAQAEPLCFAEMSNGAMVDLTALCTPGGADIPTLAIGGSEPRSGLSYGPAEMSSKTSNDVEVVDWGWGARIGPRESNHVTGFVKNNGAANAQYVQVHYEAIDYKAGGGYNVVDSGSTYLRSTDLGPNQQAGFEFYLSPPLNRDSVDDVRLSLTWRE